VQIPVSVSISALWNDYAVIPCGFPPNFARYWDVVSSTRVVFLRKRNWISDFRGVQIHSLAVFEL